MNHVSPSQLDTFTRCARQWEFRYVQRIKIPPGAAAYLGKGAHAAAEHVLRAKLEARPAVGADEAEAIAADAVRAEWEAEPPMLTDEDPPETTALGETVDGAVSAARVHVEKVAPRIVPVAIEAPFEVRIPGLPLIKGIKDVETANAIRDLKTGRKAKSQDDADHSAQLTIYALESHLAGVSKAVILDSISVGKIETKAVELVSTRDEADFGRALDRLATMDRMVSAGIFPPADPTSWVCSPRWCGYWDRCDHGGRRSVLVQIRRAS